MRICQRQRHSALLCRVPQLVINKAPARWCVRSVLGFAEIDVLAEGESAGTDLPCTIGGGASRMHSNPGE